MKRCLLLTIACMLALLSLPGFAQVDIDDLSENVTITVYSNAQNRAQRALEDDIIRQTIQKNLNIDLQLNCMPTADYTTSLNLMIVAGNVPDIFTVDAAQYANFQKQDILLDLMPYLDLMPNYLEAFPGIAENESIVSDGKLYIVGTRHQRPPELNVKSYLSLWIRQDWLNNLGLKAPTTLDEFIEIARAFTFDDPDGNGVNDTYGFTGLNEYGPSDPFPFVFGAFGVGSPTSYILQDGKAVLSATTDGAKQALAWIRDFIALGVVDPDLMAIGDYNQINEKLYTGKFGFALRSWATFVKPPFDQQLKELTPDAEWVQVETPANADGTRYLMTYSLPGLMQSGYVVGAHVADDETKLSRVLKYLDYVSNGAGLNLVCYGIEGEHFTISDGKIVINQTRTGETENGYQHQICGRIERDYLYGKFSTIADVITFAAEQPYIDDYSNFLGAVEGLNVADQKRYIQEEMVKFMYGTRSLDEFDDFVKMLYDVFGQAQYDAAINEALKNAGII